MTPLFFALVAGMGLLAPQVAPAGPAPVPMKLPAPPAEGPAPPATIAPATIPSEVMVLHATNDSSGIDPKLRKMTALSKPPFSSYNSYKLLTHTSQPLARSVSSVFNLPTGRQLQLVYKDIVQPRASGGGPRYLISASIKSSNGKSFLPLVEVKANPGEWFWVGGQEYQGGSLFIGIKIP